MAALRTQPEGLGAALLLGPGRVAGQQMVQQVGRARSASEASAGGGGGGGGGRQGLRGAHALCARARRVHDRLPHRALSDQVRLEEGASGISRAPARALSHEGELGPAGGRPVRPRAHEGVDMLDEWASSSWAKAGSLDSYSGISVAAGAACARADGVRLLLQPIQHGGHGRLVQGANEVAISLSSSP